MRSLDTEMRYARDFNIESSVGIETDDIQECKQHLHTEHTPKKLKVERTMSDPVVFKLKRTDSEIQLLEAQEAAEYHDYCVFIRIAGGMLSRQDCGSAIDRSLDSVIRTLHHDYNDDDDNNSSRRSRQSRQYQTYLPHSPDDIPGLIRTPSSIANACNADDSSCSGPLPSLVDLIGHNTAAIMDCDSSVDEDIFMLDL